MSVLDGMEKTGEDSGDLDGFLEEIVPGVIDSGEIVDSDRIVNSGGIVDSGEIVDSDRIVNSGGIIDSDGIVNSGGIIDDIGQEISAIRSSVVIVKIDPKLIDSESNLAQEGRAVLLDDLLIKDGENKEIEGEGKSVDDFLIKDGRNKEIEGRAALLDNLLIKDGRSKDIERVALPSISPSDCSVRKETADRSFGEAGVFFDRATGHSVPSFKEQFKEIGAVYVNIFNHPSEFFKGMGECVKDYVKFFKSFFAKVTFESKEEELKFKTSQALGVSEIVGKGVSIGSVSFLASLGINDLLSAPAVFACSNYIACVTTFIFTYVMSSRKKYGDWRLAYNDGIKIEAATIPATVVLYSTEIISISGLMALGLGATAASVIATIWGLVFYTGFMRAAANRTLLEFELR